MDTRLRPRPDALTPVKAGLTDERTRIWQEASSNESGGAERYKGLPTYARPGLNGHVVAFLNEGGPPSPEP
jgi:hypothetical protein